MKMEINIIKDNYKKYYDLGERIGSGQYGRVFKATNKKTKDIRALKLIDINYEEEEDLEKINTSVINEIKGLSICSNQNKNKYSVELYEYFSYENEIAIVMELCDDNLLNVLEQRKKFSPEEIGKIMIQLNETFKIMVNNNIVHRDIKLQNILVKYENKDKKETSNFIVKLTDYGISKQVTASRLCITKTGTGSTMAPEILEGDNNVVYNNKCDLWSIGIIIYQLAFNEFPYKGQAEAAIIRNIKTFGQRGLSSTKNDNLDKLIKGLLVYKPDKRIEWKDYFNHPFFESFKPKTDLDRIKDDFKKYYDFEEENKIGSGGFAKVYRGKSKETGEPVAIKVIEFDSNNPKEGNNINGFINELKNMKICGDENRNNYSVKVYEYFYNEKKFVIVMELCDDNLLKVLRQRNFGFNSEEIYKIMSQLNKTFRIMVRNKIIHRDIKLANILVKFEDKEKKKFSVKLTDYGISKQVVSTSIFNQTVAGTSLTKSPEVLEGKDYNNKCDLWSIGVIIYELAFNELPYTGNTEVQLLKNIETLGQTKFKETKDKNLDDLIRSLLIYDQKKRIDWINYFNHAFFRQYKSKEDYKKYYEIVGNNFIGRGSFGEVYKAKNKETGELVALKKIYIDTNCSEEDINEGIKLIINEINNMEICSNYNMNEYSVKLYDYFQNKGEFVFVMELCDDNLKGVLKKKNKFTPKEIYKYLSQLNNTFKIMVKKKIVHRDLKLENILIKYINMEQNDFIVKLTDYGVSKQVTTTKVCKTHAGTSFTMAPEVLEGDGEYDNKCDLWSIGVIIYQLLFNEFPFKGKTEVAILSTIKSLGLSCLKTPEDTNLRDLMLKLLTRQSKERISWEEYFNHPFFTKDEASKIKKTEDQSNQIIIQIKVSKSDKERYKKIYFLQNEITFLNREEVIKKDIFTELNSENCELYINDVKKDFKKYFEPSLEEGEEFTIKLIIKKKITNCNSMFLHCLHITSLDLSSFDSSEVKDMSQMFCKCFNLKEINLKNLDTKKVTNMTQMFQKCKSLEKINFPSSFNTQNVKDISCMFADCQNLKEVNLNFDTQNVEKMNSLFIRCYALKKIDLSSFKTNNVKNMASVFYDCVNLEEIKFDPENFKTTSVESMGHMFYNCPALKLSKLSGFNTENVKYMNSMFSNCEELSEIDLSNFSNKSADYINNMFDGCKKLKKINISSFVNKDYKFNNMFDNCPILEEVKVKDENMKNKFQNEFNKINFKI